ncbi:hypothetical protein Pmar_PMAR016636 [Perkinsus marinus ATCC 50983]|nr:hypothetical protein Pmar_PMAR016636 [Perkinsus marinus ATCC 50983]EER08534.1 hypothetical protein Pmar_PMAR016636 [Perkinsus marinus ATCC 50983]|eukprot:XP_002776718.1 hypothetical protein Pmar_PMAR016636 [Perkinsus marinus ATCC 50983]
MSVNAEGYPGDYIDLATLQGVDPYMVIRGSVLCAAAANSTACQVSTVIRAKIVVFDTSVPIVKGQQVMLYAHACVESATVTRFVRLEGKKAPPPGVRAKPIK